MVFILLAGFFACAGAPPAPPVGSATASVVAGSLPSGSAVAGSGVDEGPAGALPDLVPLNCPAGTQLASGRNVNGIEQWCERYGVMHGPYARYYDNGLKAVQGDYVRNLPDGDWSWWHENNQKASKGTYRKGKQAGAWTWWHPNGNREMEGDFLAGRKEGKWTSWYADGQRADEGLYHNGAKDSEWLYYREHAEGVVERTERWVRGILVPNEPIPIEGEGVAGEGSAVEAASTP